VSNGPDPALLNDWFTWGGVLFVVALVILVWITVYMLTPKPAPVAVSYPVSPCAPHGHAYVSQPVVWRCAHCADERVADDVYDQNAA
jgi:hypothetical protein